MVKLGKGARLAAWIVVISAVAGAALLVHTGLAHPRGLAGAGVLVALSAMVWLLATTPGGAIRLPALMSEAVVLAGLILLVLLVTRRVGFSPYLGVGVVLLNHVRERPGSLWPRIRAAPWLGNPWRLAPMLWHPALWLTALHPLGSSLTWAGLGLAIGAGVGAMLATSAGFWARGAGICLWLLGAAVALRLLW